MPTYIDVSVDVLNWVIERVPVHLLSPQIVNNLKSWVNKEKKPTFNQVQQVSRATGIPFGYFFLKHPPIEDLSFVEFRTVDSNELENPSRNLIDVMHDMDMIQQWMRDHLIAEGASPLSYVGIYKKDTSYIAFAQQIRECIGLPLEWYSASKNVNDSFNRIRQMISQAGTMVMMSGIAGNNTRRSLSIDEFRAFSLVDEYAPLIFINSNDSINAKLFSLLHEFVHICVGVNSLYNDRYIRTTKVNKIETLCNAIAAEILVPQSVFIEQWNKQIKDDDTQNAIEKLSRRFKCGATVIARKAFDNDLIGFDLYQKVATRAVELFNQNRRQRKQNGRNGGDYYRNVSNRIDRRFFDVLITSLNEGKTLYSEAFRLTKTNRKTFGHLVESVGGVPNEGRDFSY